MIVVFPVDSISIFYKEFNFYSFQFFTPIFGVRDINSSVLGDVGVIGFAEI